MRAQEALAPTDNEIKSLLAAPPIACEVTVDASGMKSSALLERSSAEQQHGKHPETSL
jgi:hypothetical protein